MAAEKKLKRDDPKQSKRFVEAAREAEADETEKGADKAFKRVSPKRVPEGRNRSRKKLGQS
jgi:hypothetical protein